MITSAYFQILCAISSSKGCDGGREGGGGKFSDADVWIRIFSKTINVIGFDLPIFFFFFLLISKTV